MASDAATPASSAPQGQDLLDTPHAGPAAIRGGAIRAIGYGIGVILSIGSAALLFRHLGVVDAGRYVTALSLVTIAGGISDLGLNTIGIRELTVRDADARHPFVRNLLGLRTALTVVGVAAMLVFSVVAGYPASIVAGTFLAGIGLVILNLQGTLAAGLTVQLRLGWVTVAELARQVVTVIGIVVLVVVGASVVPFLALSIPAALAALGVTAWRVRGEMPLSPSFEWQEWRGLLREVLPFSAAAMLGIIYFRVAIVMLPLISTGDQAGYFSASFRMIEVLIAVPAMLVSGAFPIFARAARDDMDRLAYGVQRTFETSLVVGVGIGILLIVGAPLAIAIVAGPKFDPSIGILRIQAIALMAGFVNMGWVYALLSMKRYSTILWLSLFGVTLNIVGVAIFGSAYGAKGAAWATTTADVAQTVLVGISLAFVDRRLRPGLATTPRVLIAGLVAGALAFVPGVPTFVLAAAAGVVYIGLALVLRAIPDEAIVEARNVWARFRHA
jgi:O-antigen/teichoic acid export membrane protein